MTQPVPNAATPSTVRNERPGGPERAEEPERADGPEGAGAPEYPVREYIGAMAEELAQMARWDGDEVLALLLDAAVDRAGEARS